MSYIDTPEAGVSKVGVAPGDTLAILLIGIEYVPDKSKDILSALAECCAVVNLRFEESGTNTRLRIVAKQV